MAYSSYGDSCNSTWQHGYVKMNGVGVWYASWCGVYPQLRGVNIVLIDPFKCTRLESRQFDTYDSANAATQLSGYLQQMIHGGVVVGVSADSARRSLDNSLAFLQQFGVNVVDVHLRGSFVFIAQKYYPAKTVLRKVLTEEESHIQAAHLSAIITGTPIQSFVKARLNRPYGLVLLFMIDI